MSLWKYKITSVLEYQVELIGALASRRRTNSLLLPLVSTRTLLSSPHSTTKKVTLPIDTYGGGNIIRQQTLFPWDMSKYVPLSCTGAAAEIHWHCAEGNCMSLVQCSTHDVPQIQTVNLNRKLVLTLNTSSRHGSYMHARTNTKICRGIACRIDAP